MTTQPTVPPAMSYIPTRHLKPETLQQLTLCGLPPVELLTELAVRDASVVKLRSYISLYDAKVAGVRAPRVRKEIDHFFRLWFRHIYDIGEVSQTPALPVYLPVPGTAEGRCITPGMSPFCVLTDAGYMKLRPLHGLNKTSNMPWGGNKEKEKENNKDGLLRMEESITELLRLYGLHGGSWETLGDKGVLMAIDYLSARGRDVERKELKTEHVALFLEGLADVALEVAATKINPLDVHKGPPLLDLPLRTSLLRNGVCARLIHGDKSGIRSL